MKIYPVGQGNHDNLWLIAKIKGLMQFRILIFPEDETAHIMSCNFAKGINKNDVVDYLDLQEIYITIYNTLLYQYEVKLLTTFIASFIKRSTQEITEAAKQIYKHKNLTT